MSIDMRKTNDLPAGSAIDEDVARGSQLRSALLVLLAALLATTIAYLIAGRERSAPPPPARPPIGLHAVRVRQGPEHMKATEYLAPRPAADVRTKVLVMNGGALIGGVYHSNFREKDAIVRRPATPALVVIEPEGGATQQIELPDGCGERRIRTMIGKDMVVHTEHWRWTGGPRTQLGRVVHTIDKPGLFEALCGIAAGPRKTPR